MYKLTAVAKSARYSEYHSNRYAQKDQKAFLCVFHVYEMNDTRCSFHIEMCVYTNYDVCTSTNNIQFADYLQVVSPLKRTKEEVEREVINPIDISFLSEGRSHIILTAAKVEPKLNKDGIWSKSPDGTPFMKVLRPYIAAEFLVEQEAV